MARTCFRRNKKSAGMVVCVRCAHNVKDEINNIYDLTRDDFVYGSILK